MTRKFNWINWDRNRPVALNGLLQWNNNSHLQSQPSKVFKNKDYSLKISQYSQENTCGGLKACNFIKKRLQHKYFPKNIAKYLRTAILKNMCERWLLHLLVMTLTKFLSSGKACSYRFSCTTLWPDSYTLFCIRQSQEINDNAQIGNIINAQRNEI